MNELMTLLFSNLYSTTKYLNNQDDLSYHTFLYPNNYLKNNPNQYHICPVVPIPS